MTRERAPVDLVSLGVVARAHGVRGQLRLHFWNRGSETVRAGSKIWLRQRSGIEQAYAVRARLGDDVVQLEGIETRTTAESWQGAEVLLPRADFPPPSEGEGYLIDLLGAVVVDMTGASLGVIEAFSDNGAQPLAHVQVLDGSIVLVPFVEPLVVRVEDAATFSTQPTSPRRVVLDPPSGLFDLAAAAVARPEDDEA